ncbi:MULTISPECIES: bifunctional 5,10-methylenetetrahydrofolate dehydrogenase/5,10-methenyltetrahydrofolate cyclohydrolase [unclassified Mycoplasma]|uniref:bifunctional 5,10-methylenetetrahydrofolate dehydrogenase/5,10-methenyltetrahydrofolate cyclohydrolase n=1 Tax=unclassified Mycoplasma TaxID=2683645 RepID=UPI00216AE0C8|nr:MULTISPECIES: bifunctional 5,10-methylenetetrahydrofolate dehydrogenase/5,10-methenyltetrahydrofolate cyclohydrolase [unclassified Mycoplasma]MCS4537129.1 bifunctional 5,10-methylenetetrahydrofolate dehydrogenase/5,10-methenyltetrahydrofolate cyclohydrolase [Mycoplasma sp. CSL7475-4]MCT4469865.1 bifunctional 5,10-methylenetetrahydrofolate dehydrogenase/5,10-methenyltetrahydrofolate cyclohydrolase [Mycoplasma sp. HS2188]
MKILDGKKVALELSAQLKTEFEQISIELGRKPILGIVRIGEDPSGATDVYVQKKIEKGNELGVDVKVFKFAGEKSRFKFILKQLDKINDETDGIIIQLPIGGELSIYKQPILDSIRYDKDVDGLSSRNSFNFYNKTDEFKFTPATAQAIMTLVNYYNIEVKDKRVAVIGRGILVGKPTASLFKEMGAQVSTHNRESGIKGVENADILIVAAGNPDLINKKNIKEGAIVFDVGATLMEKDGRKFICGDVNTTDLEGHISAMAPARGGVGPLTVVSLFQNLLSALKNNNKI